MSGLRSVRQLSREGQPRARAYAHRRYRDDARRKRLLHGRRSEEGLRCRPSRGTRGIRSCRRWRTALCAIARCARCRTARWWRPWCSTARFARGKTVNSVACLCGLWKSMWKVAPTAIAKWTTIFAFGRKSLWTNSHFNFVCIINQIVYRSIHFPPRVPPSFRSSCSSRTPTLNKQFAAPTALISSRLPLKPLYTSILWIPNSLHAFSRISSVIYEISKSSRYPFIPNQIGNHGECAPILPPHTSESPRWEAFPLLTSKPLAFSSENIWMVNSNKKWNSFTKFPSSSIMSFLQKVFRISFLHSSLEMLFFSSSM